MDFVRQIRDCTILSIIWFILGTLTSDYTPGQMIIYAVSYTGIGVVVGNILGYIITKKV
jgi:hypothetical protein